jgi:hypothetical protein
VFKQKGWVLGSGRGNFNSGQLSTAGDFNSGQLQQRATSTAGNFNSGQLQQRATSTAGNFLLLGCPSMVFFVVVKSTAVLSRL